MFAGVYHIASRTASILHLSPQTRSQILLAAPKLLQAIIAATGDFFTIQLARIVYGDSSDAVRATVSLDDKYSKMSAD
jgi:phosphatidylinositol glycan class B